MSLSRLVLLLALPAVGACELRKAEQSAAHADSLAAAVTDSVAVRDSIVRDSLVRDSLARDSVMSRDSTTAKAAVGTKTPTKAIGRDSAFGPSFTVDSNGKMIPIPTKKP